MAAAGARMAEEVAEQPAVFDSLVARRSDVAAVARLIAGRRPRFALLAARGSSDHAALYAKYLIEVLLQLPAGLVSPSTTTLYGARPDFTDVLYLSVSQSGGSPDLVAATEAARAQGALTVAVTNTPSSPLSDAAELSVDIKAGEELAVAATKTYTATLLSLYLLVDAVRGGSGEAVAGIGELSATALAAPIEDAVARFRDIDRVVTTGRGYSSATAAEAALKLAETSYLGARSYSGADLLHGPVAAIDDRTGVVAVTSTGHGGAAMRDVVSTVHGRGASVLAVGSAAADVSADLRIQVPETAEEVAPILEILPLQRLALALALARGGDPDNPRGLNKVTRTL
ncbi:SIS domain-containing protein [Actinophytocola algeriensis]|uniref:Glucosamine--fructose-6-phosphate aminotransferase (Isomerizing) n=1 Tax=Actinophytocola algeriensis TaxID=1768010 RepID=A0A7W7VEP4_9PSEU|nr:SIS domain-containing protein [Actinophytocola algeriensis]MBB4907319.1 glucosamine--fructose-6-phosphate aminotransferase (isomerizing) [Actinophytocola algeriensis]MBE1478802.1 glucosamine--fructose-6-phosphate aminotransferase (isomerizing) [Actinophytocola algeriensis]